MEFIPFIFAVLGYAGLTATMILSLFRPWQARLWQISVAIIGIHVFLLWAIYYEWSFARATQRGVGGFIGAHVLLALILASPFTPLRWARPFVIIAFLSVTAAAAGAVLDHPVAGHFLVPVYALAFIGLGFLAFALFRRTQAKQLPPPHRSH